MSAHEVVAEPRARAKFAANWQGIREDDAITFGEQEVRRSGKNSQLEI